MDDSAGKSDEIVAELNPDPDDRGPAPDLRPLPERPPANASTETWAEYVIALGAPDNVAREVKHWDDERREYVTVPPLTRDQLIARAEQLGG